MSFHPDPFSRMNFLPRFSRLMAEALHCGSAPEGLALPLHEVRERLHTLADEERGRPLPISTETLLAPASETLPLPDAVGGADDAARHIRLACDNARFAVYAWIDELLLQSPRLDAADWLSHSLQYRYCGTTSAGREFFTRLTDIIRSALPPAENALPAAGEEEDPADEVLRALEAFVLHGGDELSAAVIRVHALCLLYGFKGMLRDAPETLHRCRKAAHALLLRDEPPPAPALPQERPITPFVAVALEKAAYVILPPVIVLLFGALCAAVLADIPLPQF